MIKFYDTCSLLELQSDAFIPNEKFIISNITIKELEQIKTSTYKDGEIKWKARQIIKLLAHNEDKYEIEIYKSHYEEELHSLDLPISEDSKIILCAKEAFIKRDCLETGIFVTQDLACKKLAECVGLKTEYIESQDNDNYTGYLTATMNDKELAHFYGTLLINNENYYDLLINQYLLIKHDGQIVDKYKWTIKGYEKVNYLSFESMMFGKTTAIKEDIYQQCAIDSLINNQITIMRGKPGSGKSYLALSYLMSLLERGKISKIVIFVNNVAVRGAAKLGFYPGSKDEKLLDSQIGNFLISKLGSITEVEKMIDEGTLLLIPVADCRGMDTTGMNAGILVTEAQNLSRDMAKLILQRIGEDSKVIFEGDDKAQLDMAEYAGSNNGLRAISNVFRGEDIYGEINLQIIHRSRIAEIADKI